MERAIQPPSDGGSLPAAAERPALAAEIDALLADADEDAFSAHHEIATPLMPHQAVPKLTAKQGTRLRHYFERPGRGCQRYTLDVVDLDLAGLGLITAKTSMAGSYVSVFPTPLGTQALYQFRQQTLTERRPHHELASRLAAWLRGKGRITWEGIEFKVEENKRTIGKVRPDVFSIEPSQMMPRHIKPAVHEVKVSRADFFADLALPEKRQGYASVAEVVYYAAPSGILTPDDIPDEFGLVVETTEGRFEVVKRAKRRKVELSASHYLKLINRPGTFPGDEPTD